MIQLAIGLPIGETEARSADYAECLEKHILHREIGSLIVVQEEKELPSGDSRVKMLSDGKIRLIKLGRRANFTDYLKILKDAGFHGMKVFANADVHFDFSLCHLRGLVLDPKTVFAISRADHLVRHSLFGQDAWAFSSAPDVIADFPLGYDWCDWRFKAILCSSGYTVLNPAHSIRLVHVHNWRRRRTDDECVHKTPYPTEIMSCLVHAGRIWNIRKVTRPQK